MAIDRYYASQCPGRISGSVATPKIIIDMMLMEKYHLTPQEIDDIPKATLEMIMMAMNQQRQTEAGSNKMLELGRDSGKNLADLDTKNLSGDFNPASIPMGKGFGTHFKIRR